MSIFYHSTDPDERPAPHWLATLSDWVIGLALAAALVALMGQVMR